MDRFQEPMSWEEPIDLGQSPSKTNSKAQTDAPLSNDYSNWNCHFEDDEAATEGFSIHGAGSYLVAYRTYFLPIHYTASYQYPLVVWLHSNGFNENQVDQVMPHISLRNYVGLGIRGNHAADAIGHCFDWRHSPSGIATAHEAIVDSIDEAMARFSINPSRIILAGYRDGGTMALRIAMRDPSRFAGVISMGGRMPNSGIRNLQQLKSRRMPMLWQWSENNPNFTQAGFKADSLSAGVTGCQVEVRLYRSEDEMETGALRDIDDWVMRRIVSSSTADPASERWASSPTAYSIN
jgi:phospholipase/carboxylesterase